MHVAVAVTVSKLLTYEEFYLEEVRDWRSHMTCANDCNITYTQTEQTQAIGEIAE